MFSTPYSRTKITSVSLPVVKMKRLINAYKYKGIWSAAEYTKR